ncbi:MAG: carboxypeptidase regulatory-like domain-containing protein [Bacteroidales bacterium]|nr:carboxypeptidase regulatory-like domain-containing protein [Bacteroidales bacterium]
MRKKNFLHMLVTILVGVLCVSVSSCGSDDNSPAQPTTGRIVGLVTDYANANVPIAGATVSLVQQGAVKVTGSDGRFEFSNLAPGSYTITVMANNFQATTQMAYVTAGEVASCDFALQRGSLEVEISSLSLTFGKNIDQLMFYIINNSNSLLTFSFSDVPDFVKMSPTSGSLAAKSKQAIIVSVPDRSKISATGTYIIHVNVGTDSYAFVLNMTNDNVKPEDTGGETPDNPDTPSDPKDVTRGLLAFYNFDDSTTNNAAGSQNNGVIMGEAQFITDTPNGKGKALFLDQEQYVNVARNPLADKSIYTISLWAKDFGNGYLFTTIGQSDYASICISDDDKINGAEMDRDWGKFKYDSKSIQSSGWHMITVVQYEGVLELYIDGKLSDSVARQWVTVRGNKMQIGGRADTSWYPWADPFKVDNVRVYGVSLTEEEVGQLYKFEKK